MPTHSNSTSTATAAPQRFTGPLAAAWGTDATAGALASLVADPRGKLPVPPSSDRQSWSALDQAAIDRIAALASAERGNAWPQPLTSHYARYFRDGNRTAYEDRIGERQRRLSRAAVMAAHTLEPAWIDEVVDGVMLVCEQSSWCWAAHDDTNSEAGFVVPRPDQPYLDLGAGEVAGQLAWIDVVLGEAIDERAPGVRERIRHEIHQRIFRPFLERREWHWLGLDGDVHNWNPWIHGNVVLAALGLVDDADLRAELLELAIEGLDRYIASLPADGAIDEGFAYWWNGACRALETLELLDAVTDGRLDASTVPAIRETVGFPYRMQLGGHWYVNVADGPARSFPGKPWHVPYRWGRRLGDRQAMAHAASNKVPGQPLADESAGLGRLLLALTDKDWAAASPSTPPLPQQVWLPSVEVFLARAGSGDPHGLALTVKGGHNGEHHNHLDVGSFIVAVDGVPVLVDAGQPTYTAQTFGPRRYGIRAMQSGWHNVPAPWGLGPWGLGPQGLGQGVGRGYRATGVGVHDGGIHDGGIHDGGVHDGGAGLSLELAAAYGLPPGSSVRRDARLMAEDRVVVRDEWSLPRLSGEAGSATGASVAAGAGVSGAGVSGAGGPTVAMELNYLIAGDVRLDDGGAVVKPVDGARSVRLDWSGAAEATLEQWVLDDPLLEASWGPALTRLTLRYYTTGADVETGEGTLNISIRSDRK